MNSFFTHIEVCKLTGLNEQVLIRYIKREWITPLSQSQLDAEDLARIRLIRDLERDFGANEEAIPLILHLLDQLHYLRRRLNVPPSHTPSLE